jgi:transcriptional regulator with XRE-family HTH domain
MAVKRQRLAERRRALGYSQETFAEAVGVDRSTVGRWEQGKVDPHPWQRPRLAQALKTTPESLQRLLDEVVGVQAEPNERLSYVLEHPAQVDLVAVASLHERIRELDESYDKAPSTMLLGPAG